MEELIQKARFCMDLLKEKGIDRGLCSVSSSVKNEFNVDGGEFSLFRTLFNKNFSLTIYDRGRKGSIGINKLDEASIRQAVEDCIQAAQSATPDDAWFVANPTENASFTEGEPEMDLDRLFFRTQELLSDVRKRHPKILMEQMIVDHTKYESVYCNTKGVEYTTLGGSYDCSLMFSGHDGDKTSSFFDSGLTCDSLDKPFIELSSVEKDLSDVEKQIESESVGGKFEGTVVLTPASLGEFLGSAIGTFCGDETLLNGTSLWKDKLNKPVADERLTISVAPLDERVVCGERYTSEGFRSENYDLIKNGVLESFLCSQYVANKTGYPRAKNSSFSLIIDSGDTALTDLIKGIDRGILVGRISGGEPAANGEFSSVAKNAFYIEKGEIKYAIRETMFSGNMDNLFRSIRGISKETVCDGNSVLPYIAFDGVTISGKDE